MVRMYFYLLGSGFFFGLSSVFLGKFFMRSFDFPHTRKIPKLVLFNLRHAFPEVPVKYAEALLVSQQEIAASIGYKLYYTRDISILEKEVGGFCDRKHKEILVRSDLTAAQKLHVGWHELAHALLKGHGSIEFYTNSRGSCEIEADTVAYNLDLILFGKFDPLWNFSYHYISNWAKSDTGQNVRLPEIIRVTEELLSLFQSGAGKEEMDQIRQAKRTAKQARQEEIVRQEQQIFAERKKFAEEVQFF